MPRSHSPKKVPQFDCEKDLRTCCNHLPIYEARNCILPIGTESCKPLLAHCKSALQAHVESGIYKALSTPFPRRTSGGRRRSRRSRRSRGGSGAKKTITQKKKKKKKKKTERSKRAARPTVSLNVSSAVNPDGQYYVFSPPRGSSKERKGAADDREAGITRFGDRARSAEAAARAAARAEARARVVARKAAELAARNADPDDDSDW